MSIVANQKGTNVVDGCGEFESQDLWVDKYLVELDRKETEETKTNNGGGKNGTGALWPVTVRDMGQESRPWGCKNLLWSLTDVNSSNSCDLTRASGGKSTPLFLLVKANNHWTLGKNSWSLPNSALCLPAGSILTLECVRHLGLQEREREEKRGLISTKVSARYLLGNVNHKVWRWQRSNSVSSNLTATEASIHYLLQKKFDEWIFGGETLLFW